MEHPAARLRTLRDAIAEESTAAGVPLDAAQLDLAARHASLLLEWNLRTNLTRITEPREMARRHFAESFVAARLLPSTRSPRVVDIGSGGGFPGLAAWIVRPDMDLTLLEPRGAKAAFLSTVASALGPPRPRVLATRLEDYRPDRPAEVVLVRALRLKASAFEGILMPSGHLVTFADDEGESAVSGLDPARWSLTGEAQLPSGLSVVRWTRRILD